MKDIKTALERIYVFARNHDLPDAEALRQEVEEKFEDGALFMFESPRCCLTGVLGQDALPDLGECSALTVFDGEGEIMAERTGTGFFVSEIVDDDGSDSDDLMLCRDSYCYLRSGKAVESWRKLGERMLVREYFDIDDETGMPLKCMERMCGIAGAGEKRE